MSQWRLRLSALILVALAAAGCGSGGDAAQIRATFSRFTTALERHDAAGACRQITPAFWAALGAELNAAFAPVVGRVPTASCLGGLGYVFSVAGSSQLVRAGVSVTDISVHGDTATARQAVNGSARGPMRFVKVNGSWELDCCTGRQLEQQPQADYRVPSASMEPTLHIGQIIVSDNTALREHPPPLGAIVVLHPPAGADGTTPQCGAPGEGAGHLRPCGVPTAAESRQTFIKRVVGLPGDRIAVIRGLVIRNGSAEPQRYHIEPCAAPPACNFPVPITVPPDEYFVLGDNRSASEDSRFWGPVKRSWLIGIVKT